MAAADFTFSLHLAEGVRFDEMLRDLTDSVLHHVGYSAEAIAGIVDEMRSRVTAGRRRGMGCDVAFRAHGGNLEILVSQGGESVYRTLHHLP